MVLMQTTPEEQPQKPEPKPVPVKLEFRPDERKTARVVLLRRVLIWATIAILAACIVFLVRFKPGRAGSVSVRRASAPGPATHEAGSAEPIPAVVNRIPKVADPVQQVVDRIRAATQSVARQWAQAGSAVPDDDISQDNASSVLDRVNNAFALLDSASGGLAAAQAANRRILELSRAAESREAYRLSVLYSRASEYLESLEEESERQVAAFNALAAACRAALAGDLGEAGTKQNVANAYLRESGTRQKALARKGQQFEEAVRNHFR